MREEWDVETDVIVVGYGLAGGVAATVARHNGADVLILEKSDYPGGVSILAGGGVKCARDAEQAFQYLKALSGGRIEDELIHVFAEGLAQNEGFIRELASINGSEVKQMGEALLGTQTAKSQWEGVYPYPGRGTIYVVHVAKTPGFTGFPWMRQAHRPAGVNLFKVVVDNVESSGAAVRLSSPVRQLETDDEGAVIGAIAECDGRLIAVRARRAVVLASGGFEQSQWFQKQYLQGLPYYSMAPMTHTGDGIAMAQKVGASLWHMWHIHGSYGFKFPHSPIAYRHPFSGYRNERRRMPWVVVDKFGSRYMNEYHPAPQDTGHRPMEIFDPDILSYPRIPSYLILDEDGRQRGAIAEPAAFPGYEYEWSKDNSREIENGWIIRADTIEALAGAIRERCPKNEGLMDANRLSATVKEWNGHVECGEDPLRRPLGTMMRIANPPFYAVEVWPIITNTQGGPVHNSRQQVIDPFGHPIPRLYAVGELGSFFGHLYELGGNLSECFISGKIAGRNAASESV